MFAMKDHMQIECPLSPLFSLLIGYIVKTWMVDITTALSDVGEPHVFTLGIRRGIWATDGCLEGILIG